MLTGFATHTVPGITLLVMRYLLSNRGCGDNLSKPFYTLIVAQKQRVAGFPDHAIFVTAQARPRGCVGIYLRRGSAHGPIVGDVSILIDLAGRRIMTMTVTQFLAGLLMLGVAIALFFGYRRYLQMNSERRMRSMLEAVGLDPEIADIKGIETIMSEVRQRCSACNAESVCEHWLKSEDKGDNDFCPNSKVFKILRKYRGDSPYVAG